MSGSNQHDRKAEVVADDQALIGESVNAMLEGIRLEETQERLGQAQQVLPWVALYTLPADLVWMVCNHRA